jgi:hypothetical protein
LWKKVDFTGWGGVAAKEGSRVRAAKNEACVADRIDLHVALYSDCGMWAFQFPGQGPTPPEVLSDERVLQCLCDRRICFKLDPLSDEGLLDEAEELGFTEHVVQVEEDWSEWLPAKQRFVAELGRVRVLAAQVELLRRLGIACRLSSPGFDPNSVMDTSVEYP